MNTRTGFRPVRGVTTILAAGLLLSIVASCGGDDATDSTTTTDGGPTTTSGGTTEALPDLVIADVSVQPSGIVSPGEVQISATVRNVGSGAYGQTIVVQAPGNHTGVITGGLAVGASEVAVIRFPAVSSNTTYTLSLVVDPDDVIAEESESNNQSAEITITTSP